MMRHDWAATCAEVLRLVQGYLDGELPGFAAAQIERHLRQCPGCPSKRELERALGSPGTPPHVRHRILRALRRG